MMIIRLSPYEREIATENAMVRAFFGDFDNPRPLIVGQLVTYQSHLASKDLDLSPLLRQVLKILNMIADELMGRNPEHRFTFIQSHASDVDRDLIGP